MLPACAIEARHMTGREDGCTASGVSTRRLPQDDKWDRNSWGPDAEKMLHRRRGAAQNLDAIGSGERQDYERLNESSTRGSSRRGLMMAASAMNTTLSGGVGGQVGHALEVCAHQRSIHRTRVVVVVDHDADQSVELRRAITRRPRGTWRAPRVSRARRRRRVVQHGDGHRAMWDVAAPQLSRRRARALCDVHRVIAEPLGSLLIFSAA